MAAPIIVEIIANVPTAIMAKNVSTVVAILILVWTAERVNLPQVPPEGTHAAAAPIIVEIIVNCSTTATLIPARITDGVQIQTQDIRAAIGMALLELIVNTKLDCWVYTSVLAIIYLIKMDGLQAIVILMWKW